MQQIFRTTWDGLLKCFAATCGFILGMYGHWDTLMSVLVCCMGIDYVLGVIVAAMGKSIKTEGGGLSSNVGFRGILKKCIIMLLVLLASLVDMTVGAEGSAFRTMACLFYIANEGLSILENSALAGVPWPERLKGMLEQLRANGERKDAES